MTAQAKIRSVNPATSEVLGEVTSSTPEQVKSAVAAARKAQKAWRDLGVVKRVEAMQRLHDDMASRHEEFSKLIAKEMGHPVEKNIKSIEGASRRFQWNLDNAAKILAPETTYEDENELHQVHYEPFGVFGIITPWNYPLSNFGMTTVQPLLAGNTVVYKLSEEVPLFGQALNECFARAQIPEGVFNQVFGAGDVGELLARSDIDHLHFTGSTHIGKKIYQMAAERFIPATLELGGSDAGIVFEDAKIDDIVESIFWERFTNAGQTCCALKRLFVHQRRYDELVAKLIAFTKQQKIGDPLESGTTIGPMVSEKQRHLLAAQLDDAKAKGEKILQGGKSQALPGCAYFEPTLLTGLTPDMRASREELFGPVLPITPFTSEEEVIRLSNDTP